MPKLAKIARTELEQLARILILANTPASLANEIMKSDVLQRLLRECSVSTMANYFEYLTSRAKRTEISVALSYAVLIGIILKSKNELQFDYSLYRFDRLKWGGALQELLDKKIVPVGHITKTFPTLKAAILVGSTGTNYIATKEGGK